MTEQASDIAGLLEPRFLLMKRGLYYRPDNNGYTGLKSEAGRYRENEAYPDGGVTAIHENDAEEFAPGCWQDMKIAHLERQIEKLVAERDAYLFANEHLQTRARTAEQALEAAQAKVGRYEAALEKIAGSSKGEGGCYYTNWSNIDAARKALAEGGGDAQTIRD